jgi:hypothetical protein
VDLKRITVTIQRNHRHCVYARREKRLKTILRLKYKTARTENRSRRFGF